MKTLREKVIELDYDDGIGNYSTNEVFEYNDVKQAVLELKNRIDIDSGLPYWEKDVLLNIIDNIFGNFEK